MHKPNNENDARIEMMERALGAISEASAKEAHLGRVRISGIAKGCVTCIANLASTPALFGYSVESVLAALAERERGE